MSDAQSSYGEWCPDCGNSIIRVTRGIPSMGTCSEGHTTDRRDTLRRQPEAPKTYTEAEVQALVAAAVHKALESAAKKLHMLWNADGTKGERRVVEECQAAIRAMIKETPK
jgi:hypothetical protein